MCGVFPILLTPFDEQDQIDEESLRHEVDWCIEGGAHGLGIAYASEIDKLTDRERSRLIEVVVDQTEGRVPVVASIYAAASVPAAQFACQLSELGSTAVMCQAPVAASPDGVRAFFGAISDAVDIPVFVQEASVVVGGPLLSQIARENEQVRYAKVESLPPPQRVREAVEHAGDLVTVFGGASGAHLIQELRRGARGTMPYPTCIHAFVDVWDQWQTGDQAAAQEVWEHEIAPLLQVTGLNHKEVLRRDGVIQTGRWRSPGPVSLDGISTRELDAVCERLGIGLRST